MIKDHKVKRALELLTDEIEGLEKFNAEEPPTLTPMPTWTASDGTTTRLCDMPTRYLRNCLTFATSMTRFRGNGSEPGSGLASAIATEIAKRNE